MGCVCVKPKTDMIDVEIQTIEYVPSARDLENVCCLDVDDAHTIYQGMKGYARVDSIYDGDSPTLVFWHPHLQKYVRTIVRMAHYDTAELKGETEEEKNLAILALKDFERLVHYEKGSGRRVKKGRFDSHSDIVMYEVVGMDSKWKRPVVMLWNTNNPARSINAIIHERWGVDYEGRTKEHRWNEVRVTNTSYDKPMPTI